MGKLKIHCEDESVMELDGGTNDPKQVEDWLRELASTGFAFSHSDNGTLILFNFRYVTFIEYKPEQDSTVDASDALETVNLEGETIES